MMCDHDYIVVGESFMIRYFQCRHCKDVKQQILIHSGTKEETNEQRAKRELGFPTEEWREP